MGLRIFMKINKQKQSCEHFIRTNAGWERGRKADNEIFILWKRFPWHFTKEIKYEHFTSRVHFFFYSHLILNLFLFHSLKEHKALISKPHCKNHILSILFILDAYWVLNGSARLMIFFEYDFIESCSFIVLRKQHG